mmetsp:Transcript_24156/g.60339  ORF Transcript_24156/g.60339 Transcript_24156/m.60339 type:complete len:484 (-) Transcript_24156:3-1454(-)
MPVDYSKFKDVVDSDEEPVWETQTGKSYKGLPQKVTAALDDAAKKLPGRKCFCFFDFTTSPEKLAGFAQELAQNGGTIPASRELGRVIVELDQAAYAPKLCENFRSLCTGERGTGVGGNKLHYKGRSLSLILPRFCLQASIPNEYSCWGAYLPDERLRIPGLFFDRPGLLAVGNHGPNTNTCTFMITMHTATHLDGYNQIIGRVVHGMEVLRTIELFPTDRKERSYAEKNVKTWWGGKPLVDVVIADCGELPAEDVDLSVPSDGDTYPEHPLDFSPEYDHEALFDAQERIREIGNKHFKERHFKEALAKYKKAQAYLGPLLRTQHQSEFGDEDTATWMAGGHRPKDRTPAVRAKFTIKLNVCQVLIALEEWRGAIAVADEVLLELVGKASKKGNGALPNDPLVIKALFRRARAHVGLSQVKGEVCRFEEAIEDLQRALTVDDKNAEVRRELEKVKALQRQADASGQEVYKTMLQPQEDQVKAG